MVDSSGMFPLEAFPANNPGMALGHMLSQAHFDSLWSWAFHRDVVSPSGHTHTHS